MKIAIVIEKVDMRGGQNRVIAELSGRLAARHDVHIFCFEAADVDPTVNVHIMPCPFRKRLIMQEMWIPHAAARAIDPADYDVILAQGGNCFIANATLVHIAQSELVKAKRLAYAAQLDTPTWERWLRDWWQKKAHRNERRVVLNTRGAVMTVSEQLRRDLITEYSLSDDEVHSTPNGVDHHRFNPTVRERYRDTTRAEMGFSASDFVIIFMGARWREKGLDRLLGALRKLNAPDIHLMIVGRGEPSSVANLIPAELAGNIHFTGSQQPEPYFAAADAFVFPTRVEGFGLVIAEAAACGLPLVVTPAGVGAELCRSGQTGYLVPQADTDEQEAALAQQIADHIAQIRADPDAAAEMGRAAHQASLQFTWDHQADLVETVLTRITTRT